MVDTIEVPVWVKRGGMILRRDCLDPDDPDHTYNYLKGKGIVPEDYGVYHPDVLEATELQALSKERMIKTILDLRKQILGYERAGF